MEYLLRLKYHICKVIDKMSMWEILILSLKHLHGIKARYLRRAVSKEFETNGFKVEQASMYFTCILVLKVVWHWFLGDKYYKNSTTVYYCTTVNAQ